MCSRLLPLARCLLGATTRTDNWVRMHDSTHARVCTGCGHANAGVSPVLVGGLLAGCRIIQVACGNHHSVALTDRSEVYAWGHNACGQLGIGGGVSHLTLPKKVAGELGMNSALSVVRLKRVCEQPAKRSSKSVPVRTQRRR
jgi:hypothetical protein